MSNLLHPQEEAEGQNSLSVRTKKIPKQFRHLPSSAIEEPDVSRFLQQYPNDTNFDWRANYRGKRSLKGDNSDGISILEREKKEYEEIDKMPSGPSRGYRRLVMDLQTQTGDPQTEFLLDEMERERKAFKQWQCKNADEIKSRQELVENEQAEWNNKQ